MRRLVLAWLGAVTALVAQKQAFDVNAMMKLVRISDPQVSPDGRTVAFVAQNVDLPENKKISQIWTVSTQGGTPRQITSYGDNQRPRWSPDSKKLAFVSERDGSQQVWLMTADGSDAKAITNISTGADGVLYSPDGKNLVFTSAVFPACGPDDSCRPGPAAIFLLFQ